MNITFSALDSEFDSFVVAAKYTSKPLPVTPVQLQLAILMQAAIVKQSYLAYVSSLNMVIEYK